MRRAILALAGAVVLAVLALTPAAAQAGVVWLCDPGLDSNPCEIPQDTTVQSANKPDEVFTPPDGPREIDCFYVYPTVSNQLTPNADKSRDPELESIAKYQAARFSQQCRVFAPIYRQGTLFGISGAVAGGERSYDVELAYGDVLEAWREYLRTKNDGRGVVLIGHSQGTFMLRALIKEEIEKEPAQQRRVVSALLLGGNVEVPENEPVGGDFSSTPLCEREAQLGCVVAYSTFAEDPPEGAFFGTTAQEGKEVACTDPRKLVGADDPLKLVVPSEPFAPGPIQAGIVLTSNGVPPTADTTWVAPRDRFDAACKTINGAHVLRLQPKPGSRTPTWFPEPGWGTHLIDVNVTLDPLVELVARQAQRWTDPELKLKRRCGARATRLRLAGPEAELARKVTFSLAGERIGRDTSPPFRAKLGRDELASGPKRVKAKVSMDFGEAKRIALTRRTCR